MKISVIKMKKHPIDELFARKLAEHRQEPSQKAFEKFQARLQEKQTKRRGGFFAINRNWAYYAAAAGVVAMLTIGVLSQNNTADTNVAANDKSSTQVEAIKQPGSLVTQERQALIAKAKTNNAAVSINKTLPNSTTDGQELAANKKKVTIKVPAVEEKAIIHPEQSVNALALNQQVEIQPLHAETLAAKNATALNDKPIPATSKYNVGESIVLIVAPIEENTLAAVNEVESSSAEEKREKEKSFLAKLYGEYKNFKYGEKVDLKKIGVKDAVARVDEGLFKEEREDVRDFVQRRISRMQKREEEYK